MPDLSKKFLSSMGQKAMNGFSTVRKHAATRTRIPNNIAGMSSRCTLSRRASPKGKYPDTRLSMETGGICHLVRARNSLGSFSGRLSSLSMMEY